MIIKYAAVKKQINNVGELRMFLQSFTDDCSIEPITVCCGIDENGNGAMGFESIVSEPTRMYNINDIMFTLRNDVYETLANIIRRQGDEVNHVPLVKMLRANAKCLNEKTLGLKDAVDFINTI